MIIDTNKIFRELFEIILLLFAVILNICLLIFPKKFRIKIFNYFENVYKIKLKHHIK